MVENQKEWNIEHLKKVNNVIADSPVWIEEEQSLYWVDIETKEIFKYDSLNDDIEIFNVGYEVTALGRRNRGNWIVATRSGIAFWDQNTNTFEFIGDPLKASPDISYNDAVVDRQGRFLFGTLNQKELTSPDGSLYSVDNTLHIKVLDTGFAVANGIALSPDGKILYLTDMFHNKIYAYDYDISNGTVSNRKIFVDVPVTEGHPDGLIVDSDGYIWSAHWGGWIITRYDTEGNVDMKIKFPVENVTSMAFGGKELNELYVTTAAYGLSDDAIKNQKYTGDLFRIKMNIKGIVEPVFNYLLL